MSITEEQLRRQPTIEEVRAEVDVMLASEFGLPTMSWQPGGILRTLYEMVVQLQYQHYQRTGTYVAMRDLLSCDTSDPDHDAAVDLHARAAYGETRIAGVGSRYAVTVEDPAGPRTIPAYESQISAPDSTLIWRNIAAFSTLSAGTVTTTYACDSVGSATNITTGTMTRIVAGPAGLIVNNPTDPTTVGTDAETSQSLVDRCVAKWSTLSPIMAVAERYQYVARATLANCRTNVVTNAFGAGTVGVYLATATGVPSGGQVAAVQAAILAQHFGGNATCTTVAATSIPINYTATIKLETGSWATTGEKQAAVLAALTAAVNGHPVGGEYLDGSHQNHLSPETLRAAVYDTMIGSHRVVRWCDQSVPAAAVDITPTGVGVLNTVTITWS